MNRWTGTGHLTRDPKFLETESGTAICTLRIAVKRAGKQGHDGYFDVTCFDAQANACAQYLKAGREIAAADWSGELGKGSAAERPSGLAAAVS
jgi:single-stranded DNA-binding protein